MIAQGLPSGVDLQALRNSAGGGATVGSPDALPRASALPATDQVQDSVRRSEEERLDREIRAMKRSEKGPRRFAADLFEVRQRGSVVTEGGVAEDYVLGVGDRLQLNVFGSATFDLPIQVDGKGEVVIPKVGTAKVAGRTLAQAKVTIQSLVARNFSRSTAELQVVKLREVRVFVLGEVYKPGSYLVSSLSSLVNVLSLAGGPTAIGSYRDIRVMRGGLKAFSLDLYPLRAEGIGNPNFVLQSGDTIFVPIASHQVLLEGAFTRVALAPAHSSKGEGGDDATELDGDAAHDAIADAEERDRVRYRDRLEREVKALEARLSPPKTSSGRSEGIWPEGAGRAVKMMPLESAQPLPDLNPGERLVAEERLTELRKELDNLRPTLPGESRVPLDPRTKAPIWVRPAEGRPEWLRRWEDLGQAPSMKFEMKPGETVASMMAFAGGLLPEAGEGTLTLRRSTPGGILEGQTLSATAAGATSLQRGDTLSALPRREVVGRVVTLAGWARVPGPFARTEGLTVGALLRREQEVLPDTYRARGELLRTSADGKTTLLAFDIDRALAGDPAHDLRLEDRDRIELFRVRDLRMLQTVRISGPLTRPGLFPWHKGMRVSDLIFRGGVPKKSANRMVAELARAREGQPSEVRKLNLEGLLSTEDRSPVALLDEALNPVLHPDDQVSVYEKPEYRTHRVVRLSGQVARPGEYALDGETRTLRQVLQRAGGLTPEAMPQAGIFLRRLEKSESSVARAAEESGLSTQDPTAKGVNEILQRLSETKRQPTTGLLLQNPILHGLAVGSLNRLVVNFQGALKGDDAADVELQDGDEVVIPRKTQAAYVVGETASPFGTYKVAPGTSVKDLLSLAGGLTRNADSWNIRLLKADGRILDSWVNSRKVEPGDTVLVPQRIRRDSTWQENLNALTPIALILNAVK